MSKNLRSSIFSTAQQVKELVPSLFRSGLLSNEGGAKAGLMLLPVQARYRFSTAREVEQGYFACPERIALIDDDGQLTYRQLRTNSRTVASYLNQLKSRIGAEEIHLGVMARNGRGIIVPIAAKGFAGGHVYLLNIGSSTEQLVGCIKRDGINMLVIDEEFVPRLPDDLDIPVIVAHRDNKEHTIGGYTSLDEIIATHTPEPLALFPKHGNIVVMSSGTTGVPKGVVRHEPVLPTVLASILNKVPWRANMTVQMTASMFHAWGWACFNIALGMRGTIVTRRIFNPSHVLEDIETYRCDAMISSPIFLKQLTVVEGGEKIDCSSLKFIFSSGNALSPWLVEEVHERFGKILCNLYGSTEISAAAIASIEEINAHPTTAGTVCTGTDMVILDEDDKPCPIGTPGRIFCWNSVTLNGYTDPKIPLSTFEHMVQIGDRGYLDENGLLFVLGRADDMIIVGGENVYPRSVEEVLESMPGVADLYAAGVSDEHWFKRVAVWVVRSDDAEGAALTEDSVREWVAAKLAEHSVPRDVYFVDCLPRNATGKVIPAKLVPAVS
ncbi:MAG: AMP-binding protein [Corynebacterium sp.]|uniref:AMP-binding protein n=1 Tax=Corynebacterium sp. TaxID=1720 RepID=UPI0026DCCFDF|nr:AMP-binding protein [Corynebacterium sp.]MDO4762175.1 AMP-binding protein [Corynebacterium sp.]